MLKKCIKYAVICLVLIFMYVPILILAVYSFTDAPNIGPIHGFSLQNYITLFTTEELRDMITGSIMLALGSAVLATILGTTGAIGAFYSGKRVKSTISVLNQVPVVNADVVTGFSLCILLVVVFGISKDTYLPLVAGHVVLSAPFVYLAVMPKLKQMDPSLYEAATMDGANKWHKIVNIDLPSLVPTATVMFILRMGSVMSVGFEKVYLLQNNLNSSSSEIISTYVYKMGLVSNQYSLSAAIGLFNNIINLVLLIAVNMIAKKVSDTSLV